MSSVERIDPLDPRAFASAAARPLSGSATHATHATPAVGSDNDDTRLELLARDLIAYQLLNGLLRRALEETLQTESGTTQPPSASPSQYDNELLADLLSALRNDVDYAAALLPDVSVGRTDPLSVDALRYAQPAAAAAAGTSARESVVLRRLEELRRGNRLFPELSAFDALDARALQRDAPSAASEKIELRIERAAGDLASVQTENARLWAAIAQLVAPSTGEEVTEPPPADAFLLWSARADSEFARASDELWRRRNDLFRRIWNRRAPVARV